MIIQYLVVGVWVSCIDVRNGRRYGAGLMRLEPPCQCSDAAMDAGGCYYHGANCFAWILQRLRFVVVETFLVLAKAKAKIGYQQGICQRKLSRYFEL